MPFSRFGQKENELGANIRSHSPLLITGRVFSATLYSPLEYVVPGNRFFVGNRFFRNDLHDTHVLLVDSGQGTANSHRAVTEVHVAPNVAVTHRPPSQARR